VPPPRYVFIDLTRVTFLRSRGLFAVAIWEHGRVGKIKKTVGSIDALVFFCRGKTMMSDDKNGNDPESTFSFGVRELRQANLAQKLSLDEEPLKPANEKRGFDPYNTSGSFDRKKNWMRVGKR
jgi:hypothetical protein